MIMNIFKDGIEYLFFTRCGTHLVLLSFPTRRSSDLDRRVPVLDGTTRRYVNLDNAASTPPFVAAQAALDRFAPWYRSEEHTSELQSHVNLACRLPPEKKNYEPIERFYENLKHNNDLN